MWLITPRGFYSAVEKHWDKRDGMLTIRARDKADLVRLADLLPDAKPFQENLPSDYPWRIRVKKDEWAEAVKQMALEVNYSNFKDEVTRVQGRKRHDVYSRVWGVLLSLEPRGRYGRQAGTRLFRTGTHEYDDLVGPIEEPLDDFLDEPYEEGDPGELPPLDQPRLPGLRTRPDDLATEVEGDDE